MSKIINITSPHHFTQVLQSSRIVVTDFWADWCGPCKAIAPIYEQLSAQLSRPNIITFTKVDTDSQKEITQTYGVTAMPTFMIFKAGRETKRIKGADPKALDAAVKQLAQEAAKAGDGGDVGEGSSSAGAGWTAFPAPRGYPDVTDQVDTLGLDFLNLDGGAGDKKSIFDTSKPSSLGAKGQKAAEGAKKDWIESDTDEQLMLFIPFQMTLKLHSLHITSLPPPSSDSDDDEAPMRPKTIHLYTNRSTVLGFDEAEDARGTQSFELQDSDWDPKTGTAKLELRFVKFQNISSLVIFIADGEGEGEKTRVDRVRMFGETGVKKDIGKLEKVGGEE